MNTNALAFLFNADAEGISFDYGSYFDPAFLNALSVADPLGATSSVVLRGDILVSSLCERVEAVSNTSHTIGHDMELYRTIVWDLTDAFSEQWNTFDLESFPLIFARQNIHCITLPTLPRDFREQIDSALRQVKGYLGSLEIDLGSPIQKRLFLGMLIGDAVVTNGKIILELSWEGYLETFFAGADNFLPNGVQHVPYGELESLKPSLPTIGTTSERGLLSLERYERKRTYTIEERVIHALAGILDRNQPKFSFESSQSSSVIEVEFPEAKFVQYLLNPDHKDGAGKAKFFREVLNIEAKDWRYLAAQMYEGLKQASIDGLRIKEWKDGFGASFNCTLPITGRNGRVAKVFTNWIMNPGRLPQLSTARPEQSHAEIPPIQASLNTIASETLTDEQRWKAIYEAAQAAGTNAAIECVPTPMKVVGFPVEMEGLCGSASIRIPDARRGFARWVIRSGSGHRHYKSGAEIFAQVESQSHDRALAYAKAFAAVLKLNGVDCYVDSRLD